MSTVSLTKAEIAALGKLRGKVNMTPLEAFDLLQILCRNDVDRAWQVAQARQKLAGLVRESLGGKA